MTIARAAYLRYVRHCTRATLSPANHDIFNDNQQVNGNFSEHDAAVILQCNKAKKWAKKTRFSATDCGRWRRICLCLRLSPLTAA
jgi:hypothetical protein